MDYSNNGYFIKKIEKTSPYDICPCFNLKVTCSCLDCLTQKYFNDCDKSHNVIIHELCDSYSFVRDVITIPNIIITDLEYILNNTNVFTCKGECFYNNNFIFCNECDKLSRLSNTLNELYNIYKNTFPRVHFYDDHDLDN